MPTPRDRFADRACAGAGVAEALRAALDDAAPRFSLTALPNVPLTVLPTGGGVRDVPRPECIESHLPTDREPTRDDFLRAWDLCTGADAR